MSISNDAYLKTIMSMNILINHKYKISNFNMNCKLHESKELNKITKSRNSECINITENLQFEG